MNKMRNLNTWLVMSVFMLAMGPAIVEGAVIYVDADATGANDGTNWANAYNYLQDALTVAGFGDEIWVAESTYKPDEDTANPGGTGDRTATFQLKNGVGIYGGFSGSETSLDQRDWETNETILSGDLNGDDVEIVNPRDLWKLWEEPSGAENSYHVVTGSGIDATAVLDSLTITAGQADLVTRFPDYIGGGMYNESYSSPRVINCTFSGNCAGYGGGMYNESYSSPRVINCTFSGNAAGFRYGGGMYNSSSNPTVTNCTFIHNYSGMGGGMHNDGGSPTVTNCMFIGNCTNRGGGGMHNGGSSPVVTNCTFSGNEAIDGGGMNNHSSSPTVTNCTFSGNSAGSWNWAGSGGGMYNGYDGSPTLSNCTFSGNFASVGGGGMYNDRDCSPMVTNCTFSGNWAGSWNWDGMGGGLANFESTPTLTNCTFSGNSAVYGGAMLSRTHKDNQCSVMVSNCTFSGNSAPNGNAVACDSYQQQYPSNVRLANCILWDGGNEVFNGDNSAITITYSDVQAGWSGDGNIDADPMFVDSSAVDYHLQYGSPCIDAGTNTPPGGLPSTDIEGNPRINNGVVDMGAYEWQGPSVVTVEIDIKPGSWPNAINLGSYGLIPVAILSSADFDATNVDPDTVKLAGSGVAVRGKGSKSMAHEEDVNGDSWLDLVVQVVTENLDPGSFQDGFAVLTGNLLEEFEGTPIEGLDEISIVPPETEYPPVETLYPPLTTNCPVVQTKCPATLTECLQIMTECPAVSTECPPVVSKCPPAPTKCTEVDTLCPPVDTQCPPEESRCVQIPTTCPPVDTQCPFEPTRCPFLVTICGGCPFTTEPTCVPGHLVEGMNNFPVTAQCPALNVQSPTVITKSFLAKAR